MKQGWRLEKLGDVCAFLNRGISPRYIEQGGICILNQKCIRDHRVSYGLSRRHDVGVKSVGEDRFIQLGDVLVNSTGTGTLGRVAQVREIPPEPTTVDSHVTIVRPKPNKFFPDFFGYMLVLIEGAIKEAGEGCGGQTELARSVLAEKFTVSYPISLSEQQRIVAILDECFAAIAKAKANAEQNLKNAKELFESYLQSVFENKDWKKKEFWEVITTLTDYHANGSYEILKKNVELKETEDFAWMIRSTDFENNFQNDFRYIDEEGYNFLSKSKVFGREIIMSKIGNAGNVYLT